LLKSLSSLITPDHLSNHPDLGQAAVRDCLPFGSGRAFKACPYLAAHPNDICRNVAEKPLQIGWRIPVLHSAVDANNANQLTGIMSIGEPPSARRCFPLCSGIENEIGTYASFRQAWGVKLIRDIARKR
jgi:hypothetical protein